LKGINETGVDLDAEWLRLDAREQQEKATKLNSKQRL